MQLLCLVHENVLMTIILAMDLLSICVSVNKIKESCGDWIK